MKNESLEKAQSEIIKVLSESEIDKVDKAELMLNLHCFLEKDNYRKHVKILSKQNQKNKWKNK